MPRRQHDFYETPPHYLQALGVHLMLRPNQNVYEPCVGNGAISQWLRDAYRADVLTNDIDPARTAYSHWDACTDAAWDHDPEWAITNPPFDQIDAITAMGTAHCRNYVTLARLSFLEPTQNRRHLYNDIGDPKLIIVLPRYCFRLSDLGLRQTDSVTCCWLGWGPDVPMVSTVWTLQPPQ